MKCQAANVKRIPYLDIANTEMLILKRLKFFA